MGMDKNKRREFRILKDRQKRSLKRRWKQQFKMFENEVLKGDVREFGEPEMEGGKHQTWKEFEDE